MFQVQFALVGGFFFLLRLGSFPFVPFFFFFFGCFVLLMFGKFSSITTNVVCTMTNGWWVDGKHLLNFNSSLNHNG